MVQDKYTKTTSHLEKIFPVGKGKMAYKKKRIVCEELNCTAVTNNIKETVGHLNIN